MHSLQLARARVARASRSRRARRKVVSTRRRSRPNVAVALCAATTISSSATTTTRRATAVTRPANVTACSSVGNAHSGARLSNGSFASPQPLHSNRLTIVVPSLCAAAGLLLALSCRAAVDCIATPWTTWSTCPNSCDAASTQTRSRSITQSAGTFAVGFCAKK